MVPTILRRPRLRPHVFAAAAAICVALIAAPFANRPAIAASSAAPASAESRTTAVSRAQDTAPPSFTIKTRVPLTILDVVVTDANGKPVHGLKQSDFTILEDNKQMAPNSFEEFRSDEAPPAAPTVVKQQLPPNTFTNLDPAPPKAGPLNILVLDSLNTPMQGQQQVTQRMIDFINKMPPGTRVAIFALSTHLSILQGFTSDRELLKAVLSSKKNFAQLSPVEDPGQEASEPPILERPEVLIAKEGNHSAFQGQYTLSAMRQLARYLSGMPGRKNLIWFTGSFPLQFPPVSDPVMFPGAPMQAEVFDLTDEMKSATDMLAQAHASLYPVDARGLQYLPPPRICGLSTTCLTNKANMVIGEHTTMDAIADATGGKAFYNTNGFTEAAEQAIENGSNFYTITYTPTNQALDTRFRTIKVKVDRPGVQLTYRNGYYASDPAKTLRGVKVEKVNAMQAAMMRGGLDATQVLFKVKVAQAAGTEVSLPIHNVPDPKQMKPPYRHYAVTYTIDIHNIDFSPGVDGNYHAAFEYGIRVYNADGDEIVNSASKEARPVLPPAVYQSMLKTGAVSHDEIDVPAKGDYFLRIAVHDLTSDRVGATEIPVSSIAPEPVPAVASRP